jgi:polysaccharide export outer membrane protein
MKAFEPDANEEYTLGGGDEISILVAGRPELSGKYVIGPDGRISLPTAGTVDLSGLTRSQASAAVEKAYSQYYNTVSASVSVDKYGSNRVMVLGAVEHPGMIEFDQTPTLLEAVTKAGLIQPGASTQARTTGARGITESIPEECVIYRTTPTQEQVFKVNLHDMLSTGTAMADLRLRRNDKVVVQDLRERTVSVLGEVKNPGEVLLTHNSTLPSVIAEAGGLTDAAGNARISIIDPQTQKQRFVRFNDLLTPSGVTEVALQPGEVIFVPKRGISKIGYVLTQISPMTSLMSLATIAAAP